MEKLPILLLALFAAILILSILYFICKLIFVIYSLIIGIKPNKKKIFDFLFKM